MIVDDQYADHDWPRSGSPIVSSFARGGPQEREKITLGRSLGVRNQTLALVPARRGLNLAQSVQRGT